MKRLSNFSVLFPGMLFLSFLPMPNAQPGSSPLQTVDFRLSGDVLRLGEDCFQLTPAINWASGSIWHRKAIDLNAPFEMELNLFFGCKDTEGADGMVFVFHPYSSAAGFAGEGMGFAGLAPSLGIEIDTWENEHLADPYYDHIAILKNGHINHTFNLAGPNRIKNVEDCRHHKVKVKWHPDSYRLQITLDEREVISYKGNIVKDIFGGDPMVYWGFTAATGAFNNRQEICFEKLRFTEALENPEFTPGIKQRFLKGDIRVLEDLQFKSGSAQLLPSSHAELNKLAGLLKEYPQMALEIFGHTDSSGDEVSNQKLSDKRAKAVAAYLLKKGIAKKRLYPRGHGETYPIAPNASPAGRKRNRRIEVHFFLPRV